MIRGMHAVLFTPQAEKARTFINEKLGFTHVDAGDGWLILDVPQAEIGVHPGEDSHHEISFWCDDIEETVRDLQAKGVEFQLPVKDQGFGLTATFRMPGGLEVLLYEPRHPQP